MTAAEMHHSVKSKLAVYGYTDDKVNSYFIQKLLNEAQYAFIERYTPLLKENEIARKKLHPLISNAELTPAAHSTSKNITTTGRTVTLPSNFYKCLNEYITTSTDVVDVKPIDYDEYNSNRLNPFKKPYSNLVWRLDMNIDGREHELIPSSDVTIVKYRLRYIKLPTEIDIIGNVITNPNGNTGDLRVEDHEEIVNMAIGILIGNKSNVKKDT